MHVPKTRKQWAELNGILKGYEACILQVRVIKQYSSELNQPKLKQTNKQTNNLMHML
jgi:hypothetical protein